MINEQPIPTGAVPGALITLDFRHDEASRLILIPRGNDWSAVYGRSHRDRRSAIVIAKCKHMRDMFPFGSPWCGSNNDFIMVLTNSGVPGKNIAYVEASTRFARVIVEQ